MSYISRFYRHTVALLGLLMMLVPASAAYQTQDSLADLVSQTFLPAGTQIVGAQGVVYGVLLPFVIVFTLIYVGMRRMDVLGRRETQVLSLAIALFLIPSGGYRVISQFLLTLFGLGAPGFSVPGVSATMPEVTFLQGLTPLQRCTVMSLIVGGIAALILNMGPKEDGGGDNDDDGMDLMVIFGKRGLSAVEGFIIISLMGATWLTTCGFDPLINALGWLLMIMVGMRLLSAYYNAGGGGIPALLSIVGLLVIGMLIRSQSMLPQQLRTIGDWILGGTLFIVVLIAAVVVILAYISWAFNP